MSVDDTIGIVHSDGSLQQEELTLDVARLLQQAGPWGQNFPEPMFDGCFEVRNVRILGERHLKLEVRSVSERRPAHSIRALTSCEAIAFRHFDHDDAPHVAARFPGGAGLPPGREPVQRSRSACSWWSSICGSFERPFLLGSPSRN